MNVGDMPPLGGLGPRQPVLLSTISPSLLERCTAAAIFSISALGLAWWFWICQRRAGAPRRVSVDALVAARPVQGRLDVPPTMMIESRTAAERSGRSRHHRGSARATASGAPPRPEAKACSAPHRADALGDPQRHRGVQRATALSSAGGPRLGRGRRLAGVDVGVRDVAVDRHGTTIAQAARRWPE